MPIFPYVLHWDSNSLNAKIQRDRFVKKIIHLNNLIKILYKTHCQYDNFRMQKVQLIGIYGIHSGQLVFVTDFYKIFAAEENINNYQYLVLL